MFLPPIQAPDPTIPAKVAVVATTYGRGVQIYACAQPAPDPAPNQAQAQPTNWQWVFQSPEATLVDATTLQQVATHSAGPTWVWRDGSTLTGKVVQKLPSPRSDSIPWLLLATTRPVGSPTGVLSPVTLIRRSDTQAGVAPANGCDAAHAGTILRVPYTAVYTFYRPAS